MIIIVLSVCKLFVGLIEYYLFYLNIGRAMGDPHITTLDSKSYTFNGKGEYILLQADSIDFSLQARTDQVKLMAKKKKIMCSLSDLQTTHMFL